MTAETELPRTGRLQGEPTLVEGTAQAVKLVYTYEKQAPNRTGAINTDVIYFPLIPVRYFWHSSGDALSKRFMEDSERGPPFRLFVPPGVVIRRIDYDDRKKCFLVTSIDPDQNNGEPQAYYFFPTHIVIQGKNPYISWLHFPAYDKGEERMAFLLYPVKGILMESGNPFLLLEVSYGEDEDKTPYYFYFFPRRASLSPLKLLEDSRKETYNYLAYGSFQVVYSSSNLKRVIKLLVKFYRCDQRSLQVLADEPKRTTRLLCCQGISANIVSARDPATGILYQRLLEMPYFQPSEITHRQVCEFFIRAYQGSSEDPRTFFRTLADYFASGSLNEVYTNLKKMLNAELGCIDPAMFLQRNERCSSPVSEGVWEDMSAAYHKIYFDAYEKALKNPDTEESQVIFVFLAILFLQKHCPAYRDLSALLTDKELRMKCAEGYTLEARGVSVNFDHNYWKCVWDQYPRSDCRTMYFATIDSLQPVKIDISLTLGLMTNNSPVYDMISGPLQEKLKKLPMLTATQTEVAANIIVSIARGIYNDETKKPRCNLPDRETIEQSFEKKCHENEHLFSLQMQPIINELERLATRYNEQNQPNSMFNSVNQNKLSWVRYILFTLHEHSRNDSALAPEKPRTVISREAFLSMSVKRFGFDDPALTGDPECNKLLIELQHLTSQSIISGSMQNHANSH
ncbi:MAG: hypothetical protein A3E84_04430 [Gammaproteobacteria bacterium RIFCSPHIGHO2_12_FULL_42_13]|nr:MAG: hypothetical protein A3E84_04430 [Gammaproteobacteria bacterium RIFCSPHIGHO2_12_FULL_42_13]